MRAKKWKKMLAGFLAAVVALPYQAVSFPMEVRAADTAEVSAVVSGNTVSIGNSYISREFSTADNKLSTAKITNRRTDGGDTVFVPAAGSEEFKIRVTKGENDPEPEPITLPKIDKSGWTATADSWQNAAGASDGNAQNLLDNNIDSIWHTKYSDNDGNAGCTTQFPYNVIFDLKKSTTFQSFSYTPRKQGEDTNGNIKGYELYYSASAEALEIDSDDWILLKKGKFKYNGVNPIYVNLDQACTATQLKLTAVSSNNGVNHAGGAEFDLHTEKAPEIVQKNDREFVSSSLTLQGTPKIEDTEATINDVKKTGKKVTFQFAPYTFRDVAYTISEVIVMYDGDHFMRKYMEISVPDDKKADAVIDYIDLESLVTNASDATWTIPTDAGGVVAMEQFKANLGQPIYIQGMFFGCEFPVADNEISEDDGTGYMRYYSGKSFERLGQDNQLTQDGKYMTWQTVAGAARSTENEVIQADFFEYINSIATPSEFRIQYNSWFDNMMRIDDNNILESFIEIDRELDKAGVRPLDSYVVDDGWNNYNKDSIVDEVRSGNTLNETGFWEFNSKFPEGLTPSSELVHKFGSNFGVWVGPRGGYNFYGTMADILTENDTGSKAGGSIDVADRTYVKNFGDMAVEWMEQYDVNYWKWDGFADSGQYNQFPAVDGVAGYANRHMTGGFHHMYHVTDLWEAWIDMMERVRQCEKEEGINKLWISLTCYVNPSPWYLQWANSVWIQCIHDQSNQGPSSSHLDRQLTYRDAIYYDYIKNHEFQFPLSNVYNHDPIYGTEGTGMNINTATDEQFQNYLYMQSTRGTAFWELYFSDSIMTDGKYEVTDEFLEWAEENYHMLRNSKMFGESPNTDTKLSSVSDGEENAYGFACFDGTDGIISVRNPADTEKSVTIRFDRTIGVPESAGTLKYHMEHSHNLTAGTSITGNLTYGREYTFTLQPDEVRILRISKDGDKTAPKIVRAYSDGADHVTVKFNEKVNAGTFKINGTAAKAEAGADDRTFHLTAAEGSIEDNVVTVTAEDVTDLAGNALTDNRVSFRYCPENTLASFEGAVRREIIMAKARDSLTGSNGFSVQTKIATASSGNVLSQGSEYAITIEDNGTASFTLNGISARSKTVVNDGAVHTITGVKENNGMLKIYIDGEVEAAAYDSANKYYDVQADNIVIGTTQFYGYIDARIADTALGYDLIKEESGDGEVIDPGEHNWASGKMATAYWTEDNTDAAKGGDRPMNQTVDGVKNNSITNYGEFGADGKDKSSYMQVDFGGQRDVSKVNLYRYWSDGRTYNGTVIVLSKTDDFADGQTQVVYNSDSANVHGLGAGTDATYAETSEGKTFTLTEPFRARYIRVYMKGSNKGTTNHVVELEAIGEMQAGDADYKAVNRAKSLAEFLVNDQKANPSFYTEDSDFTAITTAVAAVVEGKKETEQAAVDKMASDIFKAIANIKKTAKKKLKNAVEKAGLTTPEEFYTADSIAAYNAIIDAAKAVLEKEDATEAEQTEEIKKVNAAADVLVTLVSVAKEELDNAIKAAGAYTDSSLYTPESWQTFDTALKEAQYLQNLPVTISKKDQLDQAAGDLQTAITGLTEATQEQQVAAAKKELGDAVTAAESKYPASAASKYTAASWKVFQVALSEAKDVQNNTDSTKAQLEAAKEKLENAIKGLKIAEPDNPDDPEIEAAKKELGDAVTSAESKYPESDASKYTASSWKRLQEAISDAKELQEDTGSTIEELEAAKDELEAAIKGLKTVEPSDPQDPETEAAKKELGSAVTSAESKYPSSAASKYTTASWKKLQDAIANAKAVQNNTESTKDDLTAAKAEIEAAIKGLVLATPSANPDLTAAKNALDSTLKKAAAYKIASKYTAKSWATFQTALRNAQKVRNTATSTSTVLNSARLALENAIRGLTLALPKTEPVQEGKTYPVDNYNYNVTSLSAKTVEVTGMIKAETETKIVVGDTVSIEGVSYEITSIGTGAFKNNKKATRLIIGKNVAKIGNSAFSGCAKLKTAKINSTKLSNIGKSAFANCKKLKTITIKSKSLKKVEKNAFKNIHKKATIKVPSSKLKKYKKVLAKKGQSKQVKIKK